MPAPDAPASLAARLVRWAPLALIGLALVAAILAGGGQTLIETVVAYRRGLVEWVAGHRPAAMATFVAVYAAAVAVSMPGAALLTITSGFLFGWFWGGAVAVCGATIGAVLVFMAARTAFGDMLARRAGPKLSAFLAGFHQDAAWYLLFLRLVPAFPFFLVNLAAALAGVRLRTFAWTTLLGIVPATAVFALAGSGLDAVLADKAGDFDACRAAGRSDCRLALSVADFVSRPMLIAFAGLAALALVPVVAKRLGFGPSGRTEKP